MDLRADPIAELLRKIAVPASIGMLFSTLLAIVDTFYAGMLSPTALAALSLAGPLFFLVLTLGIGVGQATNALVGNRLGALEMQQARVLALQSISFSILVSIVSASLAFAFVPRLFVVMGGEAPYLTPAIQYMRVVLLGTAFFSLALVVNSILNTRGDTRSYRNAQVVGFVANIFLDPLFMFSFGMGVVGVAVATVLIQGGVFLYLLSKARQLDFMQGAGLRELVPDLKRYREIAEQSIPTTISMALVAVGAIIIVAFVTRFGESAMAAYAIALRLEQVILLPVVGINIAALSLTSVNFGAGRWDRVREIQRTSTLIAVAMMSAGGILVFLFGGMFMQLFTDSAEAQEIGNVYLKFEAFILPVYGVIFISAAILQGIKKPLIAMFFNFFRQVLAQIVLFWLVTDYFQMDITGLWWSVLLINWVAAILVFFMVRRRIRSSGAGVQTVVESGH